jgi:hypothetical protein
MLCVVFAPMPIVSFASLNIRFHSIHLLLSSNSDIFFRFGKNTSVVTENLLNSMFHEKCLRMRAQYFEDIAVVHNQFILRT